MCSLRISGPLPSLTLPALTLTALLIAALGLPAHAQTAQTQSAHSISSTSLSSLAATAPADAINAADRLPNTPGPATSVQPTTDQLSTGNILGTVLDTNGAEVPNATVTLENTVSGSQRTSTTNDAGFFKFDAVEQGSFNLTVTSTGFAPWTSTSIALQTGQSYDLPSVALRIASATTDVEVTVTQHDIAEDQMHYAEQQRVLGVFPNFYVSYLPHAVPLSSGQKFRLALITSADPVTIAIPGIIAAIEQSQDSYNGYGQGVAGFARRFGASSADSAISIMITDAILPSLLHQDPRYFYKGTGSIRSRALYAVATAFICKGDNGRWQPNYSNVLGNLASAGISNLYYPSTGRNGIKLTVDNWLVGTAAGAAGTLFQEFLVKKISRGIHHTSKE